MWRFYLLFCIFLHISCVKRELGFFEIVDNYFFRNYGETYFEHTNQVLIKDILLSSPSTNNQMVIVEGQVVEISPNYTYLILKDETASLLISLTQLSSYSEFLESKPNQKFKIVGKIERGKKGLPVLNTRSIHPVRG